MLGRPKLDIEYSTSSMHDLSGRTRVIGHDRNTGITLAMITEHMDTNTIADAKRELAMAIEEQAREYTWFVLSCQKATTTPVLYAGGPYDGRHEELPVEPGGKPPLRHEVTVLPDPSHARYRIINGEPDWPPHRFVYERPTLPRFKAGEPITWLYRLVNCW
jgi:hypothetical protein